MTGNNYSLLKNDEKKVVVAFNNAFAAIINFYKKQITILEKGNIKENQWEKIFDDALCDDAKNIRSINDILDECIWLIQKHEPRANHLRLLIAIINSLNDLKRMSSYVVTFIKFFKKYSNTINASLKECILKTSKYCLTITEDYFKLIKDVNWKEIKEKSKDIFDKFLKQYKKTYLDIISTTHNDKTKINATTFSNCVIVLKNVDRNIDHCMSIVENLSNVN